MKDIVTPVLQEEVKAVIRKCLEQAALVNYQRLSEYAKLEGRLQLYQWFFHRTTVKTMHAVKNNENRKSFLFL